MPTYTVKDPQTGKTVKLTGDSPPTETELTEIFSHLGQTAAVAPPATSTAAAPVAPSRTEMLAQMDPATAWAQEQQQKSDMRTGMLKGAANTAVGLGRMWHQIPGVDRVLGPIPADAPATLGLAPTNTIQRVGHGIEQAAEFMIPGTAAGKAGKLAIAGKDAGLALAQTGSPAQAGVTGALSAVLPGASAVRGVAEGLETSAQKSMAQALGATKEWAKSEAAKLAPQMLERGIGGSRPAMLDLAKTTAKKVGAQLEDAYKVAAAAGETVPADIIQGNLQLTADALKVTNAKGVRQVIPGTEAVIQKLDDLGNFVGSLGKDIPVDKAAHIKRTWDHIVSKAGLFGPKATASATDNATAYATREAAGSFRELLNTNPTLADLNKEASFWIGIKGVLKETEKRTQAQNNGLIASVMASPGAVAGAVAGGPAGAVIGGLASRQLVKVLQSPAWRTQVSAPLKHFLADALASGSAGRVAGAVNRIVTALPSQFETAGVQ